MAIVAEITEGDFDMSGGIDPQQRALTLADVPPCSRARVHDRAALTAYVSGRMFGIDHDRTGVRGHAATSNVAARGMLRENQHEPR